jgi:hypothetical protein
MYLPAAREVTPDLCSQAGQLASLPLTGEERKLLADVDSVVRYTPYGLALKMFSGSDLARRLRSLPSPALLEHASQSGNSYVRLAVAGCPEASPRTLALLLTDINKKVALAAYSNPNCPPLDDVDRLVGPVFQRRPLYAPWRRRLAYTPLNQAVVAASLRP